MDEVDPEEAEEVDEGGDERDNGGELREGDDMEGDVVPDLVAPPVEEVIRHREEQREEHRVG